MAGYDRMLEDRWPNNIHHCSPRGKRKRVIKEGDCEDRRQWKLQPKTPSRKKPK